MKSLSSRTIVYGLLIVFGLLCSLPNILPYSLSQKLPAWYTDTTISMGLDLQGGSHLLLEADTKELLNKQYDLLQSELTSELQKQGIYYTSPVISESGLYIPIRKSADIDKSVELASQLARNSTDGKKRFDIKKETDGIQISLDQRWV
ncbi:hypothetical protein MAMP_02160 [Methylophaga aminisulfidivorans MP]|uniref:Protein translocase subunit SecD n=2 Tax=Methylophaga TaxID=40222 RepID=F5SXK1_9GAMM|nr:hypothetical protein [Methylophaga aminisulfidivorans]EGL55166.1 hypothetical protein MAMP_02160 [Methylophaga aminisulfidivorans MP]